MDTPSVLDRINHWARRSVTLKLIAIGILILILLIPTSMLESLIYERQNIRDEAIREVSSKWGSDQTIGGPVLTVPFAETIKTRTAPMKKSSVKRISFLKRSASQAK